MPFQLLRRKAVQPKCFVEKGEPLIDFVKRPPGDQGQIDLIHDLLKKNIHKGFDSEREPECIEFSLVVAAVHGRDIDGDVSFFVYVRAYFECFLGEYDRFESVQVIHQQEQTLIEVGFVQGIMQHIDVGKRPFVYLFQMVAK